MVALPLTFLLSGVAGRQMIRIYNMELNIRPFFFSFCQLKCFKGNVWLICTEMMAKPSDGLTEVVNYGLTRGRINGSRQLWLNPRTD